MISSGAVHESVDTSVAPKADARTRALGEFGIAHDMTPADLQIFGITFDQLKSRFSGVKDPRSLETALEQLILDSVNKDAPIAKLLETSEDEALRRISSLVFYVTAKKNLRIPFPRAIAKKVVNSIINQIAGVVPKAVTPEDTGVSNPQLIPESDIKLNDKDLKYLKLEPADINAGVTQKDAIEAVQRLYGKNRVPLVNLKGDDKKEEQELRRELKAMSPKDKIAIAYKLFANIRNEKIKAYGKLSDIDAQWLGKSPDRLKSRVEFLLKPEDTRPAPSDVGEVDYNVVKGSEVRELNDILSKMMGYVKVFETSPGSGIYQSPHPDLQRDINKIRSITDPDVPEQLKKNLQDEINRIGSTPDERDMLRDLIDLNARLVKDLVSSIPNKKSEIEASISAEENLLNKYKRARTDKSFEFKPEADVVVRPDSPEYRSHIQVLSDLKKKLQGPEGEAIINRMENQVQARRKAFESLKKKHAEGALKNFKNIASQYIQKVDDQIRDIEEKTDTKDWSNFIAIARRLFSVLKNIFSKPDVVQHLKPLWDKGAEWLHETTYEEVDKGFSGIFDKKDKLNVSLYQAVKNQDPALLLATIAKSPLLRYIATKLSMLVKDPQKHLKGPSFDETEKEVNKFIQTTSRALSSMNPVTLRRKMLNKILGYENDEEKKQDEPKTEKRATWDILRVLSAAMDPKILKKKLQEWGLRKTKPSEIGYFRTRPSKLLGSVTLRGFFDKPDYVKEFVRALNDRSKMLHQAALHPRGTVDKKEFEKRWDVDSIIAEVLGVEEKNIENKIIGRRFSSLLKEKLGKEGEMFDVDDKTGRTKGRLELDKLRNKISEIQQKYLPVLNEMARILSNPYPAIKRAIESMKPEDRTPYEEALSYLKSISPEERQRAEEEMKSKSDTLSLMKERFLSKNVLAPIMEGIVKKSPITDLEDYKIQRDKYLSRYPTEKEDVPEIPKTKEELRDLLLMFRNRQSMKEIIDKLFSPQAYSNAVALNKDKTEETKRILSSDPFKYDFDPQERQEAINYLIKRHRNIIEVIEAHKNKASEYINSLSKTTIDPKERHKIIRMWQLEQKAIDKLEKEVNEGLAAIKQLEQEYRSKEEKLPWDKIEKEYNKVMSEEVPPLSISMSDIDKINTREELNTVLNKIDAYRKELEKYRNKLQGLRLSLSTLKVEGTREDPNKKRNMLADLTNIIKATDSELINTRKYENKIRNRFKDIKDNDSTVEKTPPVVTTPQVTPGVVKTAAIEDVKDSDPEDILRETTKAPSSYYEEQKSNVRDWNLLQYLFEGAGDQLASLKDIVKMEGLPEKAKAATERRISDLKKKIQNLGKLQNIKVQVGGKEEQLKEIPYKFDDLLETYYNKVNQARSQYKDLQEKLKEKVKRVEELRDYYDEDSDTFKLSDVEKRSLMNIFYQSLYWAMQNYWLQSFGRSTSEGERMTYFGERTEEPFAKMYETFKALGGVKSNPIFQKLIRAGDAILKADINDDKHRTRKGALMAEKKRIERRWKELGYTEKEIEEAKNREPYKSIVKDIEYLTNVKKEQNRIYDLIRLTIDTESVIKILTDIANKTTDNGLKSTIEKRIKEMRAEVGKKLKEETKVDIQPDYIMNIESKYPEIIPAQAEKQDTKKTAYTKDHPDFNLRILYSQEMQEAIANQIEKQ